MEVYREAPAVFQDATAKENSFAKKSSGQGGASVSKSHKKGLGQRRALGDISNNRTGNVGGGGGGKDVVKKKTTTTQIHILQDTKKSTHSRKLKVNDDIDQYFDTCNRRPLAGSPPAFDGGVDLNKFLEKSSLACREKRQQQTQKALLEEAAPLEADVDLFVDDGFDFQDNNALGLATSVDLDLKLDDDEFDLSDLVGDLEL